MSNAKNLWSPSNGDHYTTDKDGQWYRVDHYTHEWSPVEEPPEDARPSSDVRVMESGREF